MRFHGRPSHEALASGAGAALSVRRSEPCRAGPSQRSRTPKPTVHAAVWMPAHASGESKIRLGRIRSEVRRRPRARPRARRSTDTRAGKRRPARSPHPPPRRRPRSRERGRRPPRDPPASPATARLERRPRARSRAAYSAWTIASTSSGTREPLEPISPRERVAEHGPTHDRRQERTGILARGGGRRVVPGACKSLKNDCYDNHLIDPTMGVEDHRHRTPAANPVGPERRGWRDADAGRLRSAPERGVLGPSGPDCAEPALVRELARSRAPTGTPGLRARMARGDRRPDGRSYGFRALPRAVEPARRPLAPGGSRVGIRVPLADGEETRIVNLALLGAGLGLKSAVRETLDRFERARRAATDRERGDRALRRVAARFGLSRSSARRSRRVPSGNDRRRR